MVGLTAIILIAGLLIVAGLICFLFPYKTVRTLERYFVQAPPQFRLGPRMTIVNVRFTGVVFVLAGLFLIIASLK